jgi:hypothetical protein
MDGDDDDNDAAGQQVHAGWVGGGRCVCDHHNYHLSIASMIEFDALNTAMNAR